MSERNYNITVYHPEYRTPATRRKGLNGVRQKEQLIKIDNYAEYLQLIRLLDQSGILHSGHANRIIEADFTPREDTQAAGD